MEAVPDAAAPTTERKPMERWRSLLWVLGAGGASAGVTLAPFHGECGFKYLSGAPCPGCGMTRACLALLRGDLGESWRLHPLAVPLVLGCAAAVGLAVHEGATGRATFRRLAGRWGSAAAVSFLVAFAAVWVLRVVLHPAWSPDPFRPGSIAARLLGR
jgi:hypothetical protein